MEELNLELNHTYLLRYGSSDSLHSVTVLLISDKAYNIRWNGSGSECWELKRRMNSDYTLIEDISDIVANKPEFVTDTKYVVNTKFVQCYVCKGFGTVPAPNTTAGNTSCPLCFGSKMIPEVTEIKQE